MRIPPNGTTLSTMPLTIRRPKGTCRSTRRASSVCLGAFASAAGLTARTLVSTKLHLGDDDLHPGLELHYELRRHYAVL